MMLVGRESNAENTAKVHIASIFVNRRLGDFPPAAKFVGMLPEINLRNFAVFI